jgi:hypothetical protein
VLGGGALGTAGAERTSFNKCEEILEKLGESYVHLPHGNPRHPAVLIDLKEWRGARGGREKKLFSFVVGSSLVLTLWSILDIFLRAGKPHPFEAGRLTAFLSTPCYLKIPQPKVAKAKSNSFGSSLFPLRALGSMEDSLLKTISKSVIHFALTAKGRSVALLQLVQISP